LCSDASFSIAQAVGNVGAGARRVEARVQNVTASRLSHSG
jgi:hypothetical protein